MEREEQEISLDEIIVVFKKRWKLIIIPSIIAASIVAFAVSRMPKSYESYALLRMGQVGSQPLESVSSLREIMNSMPMLEAISRELAGNETDAEANKLNGVVQYEEVAGLLKISARDRSPEKAYKTILAAMSVVQNRHETLYRQSLEEMTALLKYIKKIISPVPLSSGVTEFKTTPMRVEVMPVINEEPVRSNMLAVSAITFFIMILIDTMIAFYREGKGK